MRMPGFDRVIESCRLRLHVVKLVPIHAALRNSAPVSTHVSTMQFLICVILHAVHDLCDSPVSGFEPQIVNKTVNSFR